MKLGRLINTIKYLKTAQIVHQIKKRLVHSRFSEKCCRTSVQLNNIEWIKKPISFNADEEKLTFLNIDSKFNCFDLKHHGLLWAYNLNYMDWLGQPMITFDEGAKWIDKFIRDIPNNTVGLDPYPIALRGINWIKFISVYYKEIELERLKNWNDSLYSQYCLLLNKLEFHLLGNHLLEDVLSVFIASLYFKDLKFYRKSTNIIRKQLKEQILNDGAHYEQSPMYHCILLDRLLDCYNFSINNKLFPNQNDLNDIFQDTAIKMLGHLESIRYNDGTIPLVNDSAYRIAPLPDEIFDYAKRLELNWSAIQLNDCGYRRFNIGKFEGIIDVGDIKASYQPGHSHADTFNFELRIDGQPFIIDTGISTYEKNQRRQYERSTAAHNTVTVDGKDSSEVWSGFRIGNRAKITLNKDTPTKIEGFHNGFGKHNLHIRTFEISEREIKISDIITGGKGATSRLHLSPKINNTIINGNTITAGNSLIEIQGAQVIAISNDFASTEYNQLKQIKVIEIQFDSNIEVTIKPLIK